MMTSRRTWTIALTVTAYSAALVLGGLFATGTIFAQANPPSPECRADHDGNRLISHSEAVSVVADYLLAQGGGWTRQEVVSVVTRHLLGQQIDCDGPPDPLTLGGTAVVAVDFVGDENGLAAWTPERLHYWGIGETLFRRAQDDSSIPWLATGVEIRPDLSGAKLSIRQDVPFHDNKGNFGNLSAVDVAWSMNMANQATNPGSASGQSSEFAALWGEWTALDDATVEFDFNQWDFTWKDDLLNQSGQSFVVFSKTAFDTMGHDWARDNVVATGPFEVESWDAESQVSIASRYIGTGQQHYLPELTPKSERVQFIQVPDPATRNALLRAGEVDAGVIDPAERGDAIRTGFLRTGTGNDRQLGVFFSGNLWEDVHAATGDPLPPKIPFEVDWPWIGSPGLHNGGAPFDDMEQARLIRRALAISIDRDLVNEALLDGLGQPAMVEYFSTSHPNWDPKWNYPYDPDEARRILSDEITADYEQGTADTGPGNLNGNAFEISVYAGPELGGGASITGEVTDAVAAFWAQLGLETFSLKFPYSSFRPTLVERTNTIPWVASCDKGGEANPWHFPKGLVQTTLTRGGFGCGFESPDIVDFYRRMATAPDVATATQAANEYLDYVYFWTLQPGVVVVPNDVYFNPKKIVAWPMAKSATSVIDSVWNIELQP